MAGLFAVAASAVILEQGCVLVLRRSAANPEAPGEWDLPNGRLEQGETVLEGLHREVAEETGLAIEELAPADTWRRVRADGQAMIGITYLCRRKGGEIRLSPEHEAFRWLPLGELDSVAISATLAGAIRRASIIAGAA